MSTLADTPRVPLEIAENVMDNLDGHVLTLCSCALTCRGWLPRARFQLMVSIRISTRDDIPSINDYLNSHPHLANAVRKLSVAPSGQEAAGFLLEAFPVFLVARLPNLRKCVMRGYNVPVEESKAAAVFHPLTLAGMRTYLLVEMLNLYGVMFRTSTELARLLSSLPRLRFLSYASLDIQSRSPMIKAIDMVRFRDKCSLLSELTVKYEWMGNNMNELHILDLVSEMSISSLEILRLSAPENEYLNLDLSKFKRLRVLELDVKVNTAALLVAILGHIYLQLLRPAPQCLDVLIITFVKYRAKDFFVHIWACAEVIEECRRLEDTLLTLGISRFTICIPWYKPNKHRNSFLERALHGSFPRLHEQGSLETRFLTDRGEVPQGHNWGVSVIAASPDSRYFATGAAIDGTVMLWSGAVCKESRLAELQCLDSEAHITSLHFSLNGEFLAAIQDSNVLIWRTSDYRMIGISNPGSSWRLLSCAWEANNCSDKFSVTALGISKTYNCVSIFTITAPIQTPEDLPEDVSIPTPFLHPQTIFLGILSCSHLPKISSEVARSPCGRFVWAASCRICRACNVWDREAGPAPGAYGLHRITYDDYLGSNEVPNCATLMNNDLLVGFNKGSILCWDVSSLPLSAAKPSAIVTLAPPLCPERFREINMCSSPQASFLLVSNKAFMNGPPAAVLRRTNSLITQDQPDSSFALHFFLGSFVQVVFAASVSPYGRYIATAYEFSKQVHLWSTRDGSLVCTFREHASEVVQIAFSADETTLISADKWGGVCIRPLCLYVDCST